MAVVTSASSCVYLSPSASEALILLQALSVDHHHPNATRKLSLGYSIVDKSRSVLHVTIRTVCVGIGGEGERQVGRRALRVASHAFMDQLDLSLRTMKEFSTGEAKVEMGSGSPYSPSSFPPIQ